MEFIDDFLSKVPRTEFVIGSAIILVPILILILLRFANPAVRLDRDAVIGCYIADRAPTLNIRADHIDILDGSRRSFTYEMKLIKSRHLLEVSPALRLETSGDGFEFVQDRGIGFFWRLLDEEENEERELRRPENFNGRFSISAGDATPVIYVRSADEEACYGSNSVGTK